MGIWFELKLNVKQVLNFNKNCLDQFLFFRYFMRKLQLKSKFQKNEKVLVDIGLLTMDQNAHTKYHQNRTDHRLWTAALYTDITSKNTLMGSGDISPKLGNFYRNNTFSIILLQGEKVKKLHNTLPQQGHGLRRKQKNQVIL